MRSAPASLCMSLRASPCSKQVLAERSMLALSPRFARIRLLHGTGGRDALSVLFVRFASHVQAIDSLSWRFGPTAVWASSLHERAQKVDQACRREGMSVMPLPVVVPGPDLADGAQIDRIAVPSRAETLRG